jgi:hypothetical protein
LVWWIGCLLIGCDLCLAVLLTPLRVRFNLQGRGEPSGTWALAGGASLGPIALSGGGARGVPLTAQLHAFGRRLWTKRASELLGTGEKEDEPEARIDATAREAAQRVARYYRKLERWFDPVDVALFVLGERRRLRARQVDVELGFSFEDVFLTGRVLAAVYVLRSALPPPVVIRERHSWESVDRLDGSVQGEIEVWPVLAALDLFFYLVRNVRIFPRREAARGTTEST